MRSADQITLPPSAQAFVTDGGRDIDTEKLGGAEPPPSGATVRLLGDRDQELGLAISDPENQRLRLFATPDDGFASLDGALFGWHVERALALRRTLGVTDQSAVFRLLNGAGDALPGLACDVYGSIAVLYVYGPALLPIARVVADAVRGFCGLDGVVLKLRSRGGAQATSQEQIGEVPERVVAEELGTPYEIHPLGGLNVGLFTDMRDHRKMLAGLAPGRTVLNLFSYTGSLGMACALAGAAQVTNVDTSEGVQAWARENYQRSKLTDERRYRFPAGDAVRFLARAAREREHWDLILIDPPSYSPARGKPWSLIRDYPALIAAACKVLVPDGLLWLAANSHELPSLIRLAQAGFRMSERKGVVLAMGGLPVDYPTVPAQPRDRYLQVALFRVP